MRGDDELHVGIELQDEVDELLLPFKVQAHFGFIHAVSKIISICFSPLES